jgi:rhodanese-related sulfurtransferase
MRATFCSVAIYALCAAAAAQSPHETGPEIFPKALTYPEFSKIVDQPGKTLFLDVREPMELAMSGTLKGAVNIPLGELEKRIKEVPRDRPIVTMCARGVRAAKAAGLLAARGYDVTGSTGLAELQMKRKEILVFPKAEVRN